MLRRKTRNALGWRRGAAVALLLMVPLCAAAKEKKAPEQFSTLKFLVLRASDGRPIMNASVVLHSVRKDGSQARDGLQLKTGMDGRTSIDSIPYGRLRIQVVAPRLQTYGRDVEINAAEQEFVIRLKPPVAQLSIYK
jgi:hypothetical protein